MRGLSDRAVGWVPPRSPYGLIQEDLYPDEWLTLVACMMLNCTSRRQVERVLPAFVRRWPSSTAVLQADAADMAAMCRPLGFANRRTAAILRMTRAYASGEHTHASELPGIGQYAGRAWEIFFTGVLGDAPPRDHALVRYWEWATLHGYGRTREERSAERKEDTRARATEEAAQPHAAGAAHGPDSAR